MQTIEISGHIYAQKEPWETDMRYVFFAFGPEYAPSSCLYVCPHKMIVEVPSTFNPVAAEVEAIERENERLRAEFNRAIARNNERLAQITAIEYTPAQEAA